MYMSYPIQKAGSASDIISKNQIQTQYANILSQQLAVESGIQAKVTYVSGGAGASSTLISASKGNTIFTIAELRSVVNNIISNTATTEAQAAALAGAASRKLGIIIAAVTPPVVIIDDYSPVINLILEENTLNTGTTSATLSVTNTVPITFETKVGKLSGYFPGSILSYLSIPFNTIASGSFSVSYWFNPFDGGYYDPWSLSFLGTSGNDWGLQTDINPTAAPSTQSYNIRMSGITTPTFTFTPAYGGWNYITVTISNTSPYQFKAYLNGVLQGGTATGSGPFNTTYGQYLFIGREGGNTRTYKGNIRRFMVHNFVLSQAQITSLYSTQA
jgi:hypothetical protein